MTPKSDYHLILLTMGNDHQLKRLWIDKQILLVSTLGNVQRTVWRICILMIGCKGLKKYKNVTNM